MQQNTAAISDRLTGVLSHLSSFVGQDSSSAAVPVCGSHDRDSFIKRVHSFQSSSWFAKPLWLSPITCARYGWMNVDIDVLHCVGCRSVLVVRTPASFDPAIYDACQKRIEDQLRRSAHHPCCTWPSCPTPELIILAHAGGSQAAAVENFVNKALLLCSVGKDLPAIEHSSLNVTESDITSLCSLVRDSPKFQHGSEIPGVIQSAVLLALTGWDLTDGGKALPGCASVRCSLCMRQPGLWNYVSVTASNDATAGADSHGNDEPLLGEQMDAVEVSVSVCECSNGHRSTSDTFPTAVEDYLPSVTVAKCIESQQECLVLSHVGEAMDNAHDGLPSVIDSIDEACSLAIFDEGNNSDNVTSDIAGQADTDSRIDHSCPSADHERLSGLLPSETKNSCMSSECVDEVEHFAELTESLGDDENMPCDDGLQTTDSNLLPYNCTEEEHDAADNCVSKETEVEESTNGGDGLDVCPEYDDLNASHHDETEFVAAGSDDEETDGDPTNIVTACDKHSLGPKPCEDESNSDQYTRLDNIEDDTDESNNEPCLPSSPVVDVMTTEMKFPEATRQNESSVVPYDEDIEPFGQEAVEKNSTDAAEETVKSDSTSSSW